MFISSTIGKNNVTFTNNTKDATRENISGLFLTAVKKTKKDYLLSSPGKVYPIKRILKFQLNTIKKREKREQNFIASSQFFCEFKNLFFKTGKLLFGLN